MTKNACEWRCTLVFTRGLEKEEKEKVIPTMNEESVREFTKKMRQEAEEEYDTHKEDRVHGLGYKLYLRLTLGQRA